MSARDAVVMWKFEKLVFEFEPDWGVRSGLGRVDSLTAIQETSNEIMPSPRANATSLIQLFTKFNLSTKDLAALFEPGFREKLDKLCPLGGDESITGDLDATPKRFDNQYFKDLMNGRGFLNSDQILFTSPKTSLYKNIRSQQARFLKKLLKGVIKTGALWSGHPREIRRNCRVANSQPVEVLLEV